MTSSVRPLFLPALYQDAPGQGRLILRDGSTANLRPAQPSDREAMGSFYRRLTPASRRFRFFTDAKPGLEIIDRLCDNTDPRRQWTLVVTRIANGEMRIIAAGSYIAMRGPEAEFAVAVDDAFHGKGIGGILLERLALLATSHGFSEFVAVTHPDNKPMLDVFRNSGFAIKENHEEGAVEITFSVMPGAESVERSESRDRLFTNASIRPFFHPNAVAVIGASRDPKHVGHRIVEALMRQRFEGPVYPVNPQAVSIASARAYPGITAVPGPVDLAIIAVPREQVPAVVDDCAKHGVHALVVVSSGFSDAGPSGASMQKALVEQVRGYGMRMLGPNCLGLLNTDPSVSLNATFSTVVPPQGRIAISSQSGGLGLAILRLANQRHIGLSHFVSMGNKADVTGNDLLHYWQEDAATRVILLYLESFGNPRRFSRIARNVARSKPIICVKGGRHQGGDLAVDALFRQTGVIRADSIEDMFETACLLGNQPLPAGNRVAIVANSHGCGVLCRDACDAVGLSAASPVESTCRQIQVALPSGADVSGTCDMTAEATAQHYREAVEYLLLDKHVDALIVIYTPVLESDTANVVKAMAQGMHTARERGAAGKPVLAVLMSEEGAQAVADANGETIPCYQFPETAARALGRAATYSAWRDETPGMMVDFEDIDAATARKICEAAISLGGDDWLSDHDTKSLLESFALPFRPASGRSRHEVPATGIPVRVVVREDPTFGPLVSLGLADEEARLLDDVSHRITPLTDQDAARMIRSLKSYPILTGEGAEGAGDIPMLEDLLLRVSLLVEEIPHIREIHFEPILVCPPGQGCRILSARVRVGAARI